MSRVSNVYLMHMDGEYKIGVSDNPQKRAREIGREYSKHVSVIHCFHTPYPFKWEGFFHWLFRNQSTGDEFFLLSSDDVMIFCRYPKAMPFHPSQRQAVYELVHPYRYDKYLQQASQ